MTDLEIEIIFNAAVMNSINQDYLSAEDAMDVSEELRPLGNQILLKIKEEDIPQISAASKSYARKHLDKLTNLLIQYQSQQNASKEV